MPEKVFDKERAMVTAGLANEVEGVNQYAAAMYAATANGIASAFAREHIRDHRDTVRTWLRIR